MLRQVYCFTILMINFKKGILIKVIRTSKFFFTICCNFFWTVKPFSSLFYLLKQTNTLKHLLKLLVIWNLTTAYLLIIFFLCKPGNKQVFRFVVAKNFSAYVPIIILRTHWLHLYMIFYDSVDFVSKFFILGYSMFFHFYIIQHPGYLSIKLSSEYLILFMSFVSFCSFLDILPVYIETSFRKLKRVGETKKPCLTLLLMEIHYW